ncbi:MAG TPA: type II secretion system protein [Syntrophales bacterium]|nr:type II secretion system protein [Syntrophales bacterium]
MKSGLTLVEILVAIVMLAIVAAMMAPYFGSSISLSSTPIARLQASANLSQVLENMTTLYSRIPHWRPSTSYAADTLILPSIRIRNGFHYRCTGGGTSGENEPAWPITAGATVSDGTVTWQNNGAAPTLTDLQTAIGAPGGGENQDYGNAFGNYRVLQNRFIKFDASNREENINGSTGDPAYGRYLKVVVGHRSDASNRTGETRTALFVLR